MTRNNKGESPGMRGYIESADTLIADGISSVKAALKNDDVRGGSAVAEPDKTPLFLLGSSMGGAIAVEVATGLAAMDIQVAGLVLLAPMLGPVSTLKWQASTACSAVCMRVQHGAIFCSDLLLHDQFAV